ncbi:MAG: MATE family efflux transporter [Clostridia bacterium]|nr:MATE family efflux transporter [Clostridia bacterium]
MSHVSKNEMDMTSGNLFKKIFLFSLPIILSGLLQLLYNAADLIVCGKFGSEHSVGAISATNSLTNLIIQLFMGLSVGANVLMARCFGANHQEKGQRIAYTSMIMSAVLGVILGVFGALCSGYFLIWMKTPDEVIDLSTQYLRIYFCGVPFSLIYNFGASLLRAVGDTKRPFYFLAISGIFNVLFNLLFVIVFKMDVAGVALGTILSQAISAVCVMVCLVRNKGFFHFSFKEMRFYKSEALEIARVGLPAGLQGVIFSLSNVLIQSSVNDLGAYTVDGNGASGSIEGFVYVTMNSVAQACIAFVSANFGVGKWQNIKKSVLYSALYVCIFGISVGVIATIFGKSLLAIYLNKPEAIEVGYSRLRIICLTYFLCGLMDAMAYAVRGIGYSLLPTIVSLCGACGLRILWIYTIFKISSMHSLQGLAISYPVSWLLTFAVHLIFFIVLYIRKKRLSNIAETEIIAETSEENN